MKARAKKKATKVARPKVSAKKWADRKEEPAVDVMSPTRLWWKEPVKQDQDTSVWDVWTSECGRYRVVRSTDKLGEPLVEFSACYLKDAPQHGGGTKPMWDFVELMPQVGYYPRLYKHLDSAFAAIRKFHEAKFSKPITLTNEDEILAHAEAQGMTAGTASDRAARSERVSAKEADAPTKEGKAQNRDPKAPRAPRTGANLDRFGSKVGSNRNKIHEAITSKPKTVEQIVKDSGQGREWVEYRVKELVKLGFVEDTGKGFRETGKTVSGEKK